MKKHIRSVLIVSALCFSVSAYAFGWLFSPPVLGGAMWLYRTTQAAFTFTKVSQVVASGATIGTAVVLYDKIFDRLVLGNGDTSTPPKFAMSLDPSGTRSRENPDPRVWQSNGARDVTPKPSYPPADAKPGNGSLSAIASFGLGSYTYQNTDGTVTDYEVVQYYQAGLSQANAESAYKTANASAHTGWSGSGIYVSSTDWRYVWYKTRTATCYAGYTMVNGTCTLSVAATAVQKPTTQPCEVIKTASGWSADSLNPNCSGLQAQLQITGSKIRTSSIGSTGSEWVEVESGVNDSGVIRASDGTKTWEMPYAPVADAPGSYSIPSTTLVSDTATGTGTGTGTGTSSTSINWICGVSPLPSCNVAVDSTGVPSTVDALANPSQVVKDTFNPLDSKVSNPDGLWPAFPVINWNFALPTYCSVISVPAFSPALDSIDICQFQPTFHSIMSVVWVLGGLFGSIGLFWRNVMATN